MDPLLNGRGWFKMKGMIFYRIYMIMDITMHFRININIWYPYSDSYDEQK